jgi:hypothetical protein
MSCNSCNSINPTCGCSQPTCFPTHCDCPVYISSDCVNNVTAEFECSQIESGLSLTQTLELLDQFICDKYNELLNYFTLINVGTGAEIYAGNNLIGQKKIRTLTSEDGSVTITEDTDTIDFSFFVDVDVDNQSGLGVSVIRDVVESPQHNFTIRAKKIKSDTLLISETNTEISIESPDTLSGTINGFYINSAYVPSYADWVNAGGNLVSNANFEYIGEGTLSKPYTNSIKYTSPTVNVITANSAIQNGLDEYQLDGTLITIQNSGTPYTFSGNLNYSLLNIKIESGAEVISTTVGFLLDMDDAAFDTLTDTVTLTIEQEAVLKVEGLGFNNSGNAESGTTYATGKGIMIKGDGLVYSDTNDINTYLINSDTSDTGNNNDGNLTFDIRTKLRADFQGIYYVGGNSRIDIYSELESGLITNTVDLTLKAFHQTGGQVRLFNSDVKINGTDRDSAITFNPTATFTPIFISTRGSFSGNATNLFEKQTTDNVTLQVTGSNSDYLLIVDEIFESPNLWSVDFNNNNIYIGNIDTTKADLTKGNTVNATNFVGGFLIESLRTFVSKNSARLSLLPKYSAYIVERDVNATDLQPDVEYRIKTAGSPSLGTVGTYFIATGSETGTGVATLIERCIMI